MVIRLKTMNILNLLEIAFSVPLRIEQVELKRYMLWGLSTQDVLFKTEWELVDLLDVPFEEVQSLLAIISAKVCPPCHSVWLTPFSRFWLYHHLFIWLNLYEVAFTYRSSTF